MKRELVRFVQVRLMKEEYYPVYVEHDEYGHVRGVPKPLWLEYKKKLTDFDDVLRRMSELLDY